MYNRRCRETGMSAEDVLQEQIAYYQARAGEYDGSLGVTEELNGLFADEQRLLQQIGPVDHILELACGTGIWTRMLLTIGQQITAIDAAPEMLAINARK